MSSVQAQSTQPAGAAPDIFDETFRNIVEVCEPTQEQQIQLRHVLNAQRTQIIQQRAVWDEQRKTLIAKFKTARANQDKQTMDETLDQMNLIRRDQRNLATQHREQALQILNREQQIQWVTHEILSLTQITLGKANRPTLSAVLIEDLREALIVRLEKFQDPVQLKNRDIVLSEVAVWVRYKTRQQSTTQPTE